MPQVGIKNASVNLNFGKRKERSQMAEIYTLDGRILTRELDVVGGCMIDPNTKIHKGYLIDPENQYTDENGDWVQILAERHMIPISMIKESPVTDLKKLKENIFLESHEEAKINKYDEAAKNALIDKILWIITIPCITFLLIFAIQYLGGA